MSYYMTSKRSSEVGFWEKCQATELSAAKREATRRYGAGFIDATILISTGDDEIEPRRIVAGKGNHAGARWENVGD